MDDETGWNEILVEGWGPLVRAAVVERVERAMIGRRGVLVRALGEEASSAGHAACVEEVHERIVDAIHVETGADLDDLGSQAAWATYDQVWGQLQERWTGGRAGGLVVVPPAATEEVVALLRSLTPTGAQHAGADIGVLPFAPLLHRGRVVVDVEGLFAYLALDAGEVTDEEHHLVDRLVLLVRSGG